MASDNVALPDFGELRRIFGEPDEQPSGEAFIRCDGSDLELSRVLECSGCGSELVGVHFPTRIRSHWRRDFLHDLEVSVRLRLERCPSCNAEWTPPPYGRI